MLRVAGIGRNILAVRWDTWWRMIGDILVGRFRLEERLGGGAQGEIYRARDLDLSRWVAIKIPNDNVGDDYVKTFKREAKLLVKFEHANVVTLHDFYDPPEGMPFLVMEYLQGQPLDERLKQTDRPLTRTQLREFAKQICGALQKAHDAGLVHRDIKPSNVMMVDEGKRSERFVMLDLGIAKLAEFATMTNPTIMATTNSFAGTIAYMSPEQLEGGDVDFRSDIYSFGTTLYQVFTGKLPFPPPDSYGGLFGFMQKVVMDDPPSMSEIAPDHEFDDKLEELVRECMAKTAEDRPDSMQTVLQRLLECLPDEARPDTSEIPVGLTETDRLSLETLQTQHDLLKRASGRNRVIWGLLGILAVAGIAFGLLARNNKPVVTSTPGPEPVYHASAVQKNLELFAGDESSLSINVSSDEAGQAEIVLKGIQDVAWGNQGAAEEYRESKPIQPNVPITFTLPVTAKLNTDAQPRKFEASYRVEIKDPEEERLFQDEKKLPLVIQPAQLKFTDNERFAYDRSSGLFPHPNNAFAGAGMKRYLPARIESLTVNGKEFRVPFLLIHRGRLEGAEEQKSAWPAGLEPFYMMESKVPNELVLAFSDAKEGLDVAAWTLDNPEEKAILNGKFKWLENPKDYPKIPAMNLRVQEAYFIARWISHDQGRLPTLKHWDAAAGYYDRELASVKQQCPQGPYQGIWKPGVSKISLNHIDGEAPPAECMSSADDIGPYGCRDMAGNGREFTGDVFSPDGSFYREVSDNMDWKSSQDAIDYFTKCRGQQYHRNPGDIEKTGKAPLTYETIHEDRTDAYSVFFDEYKYPDRNSDVGFRVMVPIPD